VVSFALRRPISFLTIVIAVALVVLWRSIAWPRTSSRISGCPSCLWPGRTAAWTRHRWKVSSSTIQMEGFIINYYECHFLYIIGIEHVKSKSIQGVGLIKLQFHPGTNNGAVDRVRAFRPRGPCRLS
jgi:hypothetical protein